jgi:hypothetical protein
VKGTQEEENPLIISSVVVMAARVFNVQEYVE